MWIAGFEDHDSENRGAKLIRTPPQLLASPVLVPHPQAHSFSSRFQSFNLNLLGRIESSNLLIKAVYP
jgi:hypothetical protein